MSLSRRAFMGTLAATPLLGLEGESLEEQISGALDESEFVAPGEPDPRGELKMCMGYDENHNPACQHYYRGDDEPDCPTCPAHPSRMVHLTFASQRHGGEGCLISPLRLYE